MRAVAVVPLYPPHSRVGAWLATHSFLRGLVDRGYDVTVVPFMARPAGPYVLDGITIRGITALRGALADADVVIAHAGSTATRDALDGYHVTAPVVRIVHGLPCDPTRMAGAALIVANSTSTAAAFAGWRTPVVVCHPATDPAEYRTSPGDRVTLVNLAHEKGGHVFWGVAHLAPDLGFLGVRGGYGTQLVQAAGNVDVVGPVQSMREHVYARTRLLLMPSKAETWGMTAVEAMCSGIPVLARPTPGLRDSLGRAGNWCDSDDPAAWLAQIRALLEPRRYRGAARRARSRIRELDWQAQRDLFADSIEKVVADA